ncbi:phage tail tape measure protein [Pseudomonas sp. ICMP 460]|uniref:phage tail tape measure protein n=1 Tax=Pseudomonas sp. ICMP 460 TaxID=1718917 RepID=UPI002113D3F0|nr:phage tail tape measure protein [Pseudomonas sp. ICMP 460]
MQDKYSLTYATAKDGQQVFGSVGGAMDAAVVNAGALVPETSRAAAASSGVELALANAGLEVNRLSLSLSQLRDSVDALETSLLPFKALDVQPSKTAEQTEPKAGAELTSNTSENISHTRESIKVVTAQVLDPVAALRSSNANLSLDTTTTSQKSISVLREESTESESRLSKTLEPAPMLFEGAWLKAKTRVVDGANELAGDSPVAASALKTAGAVIMPMLETLGETIKTRVTDKVVDGTLGKLPFIGELFKGGDSEKGNDKDGDKDDGKDCCCPPAAEAPRGRERFGPRNTGRKTNAGKPKPARSPAAARGPAKKTGGFSGLARSLFDRVAKPLSRSLAGFTGIAPTQALLPPAAEPTRRKRNNAARQSAPGRAPGLVEASARSVVPMPSEGRANTSSRAQPNRRKKANAARQSVPGRAPELIEASARRAALTPSEGRANTSSRAQAVGGERLPAAVPGSPSMPTSGLMGTLSKLESSAARRLGPLKYVDTAMDVIQGVRNGDAKAIGTGLSTAGGAWAGASAGAAIGTLILPGVGTAVGGAIGGLLGSEAGTWLAEKVMSTSDRLPSPTQVSQNLNSPQADNRPINFAPQITITAPEQASHQELAALVVQQIEAQFTPLSMDNLLATRRDAALTDGAV